MDSLLNNVYFLGGFVINFYLCTRNSEMYFGSYELVLINIAGWSSW